jgi:amino acid transporter
MWHRSGEIGELARRARGVYANRKHHMFGVPVGAIWFRNTLIIFGSLIVVYFVLFALAPELVIGGVTFHFQNWSVYIQDWFLVLIAIAAAVLILRKTPRR